MSTIQSSSVPNVSSLCNSLHLQLELPSGQMLKARSTGTTSSDNLACRSRSPGANYNDEDVNCTVFEVEEWGSKRWIRVEVVEPVTLTAKNFLHLNTSFTTYLIRIETNHYAFSHPISEVRRRYSEFSWLRSKLTHNHPNKVVPPLPPKVYFNITRFNERIINERRYGLGKFLQRVFRSSVLLSDSALHLFLQTNLTTEEIDERVESGDVALQSSSEPVGDDYLARSPGSGSNSSSSSSSSGGSPTGEGGKGRRGTRPYLFRSVSLSSSRSGGSGEEELEAEVPPTGAQEEEEYCDISSSEEFEINVGP